MWTNMPDDFESKGVKWIIKTLPIDKMEGIGFATNLTRLEIEEKFLKGGKLPLCLVEQIDKQYELHDGQHRFAAYKNVFPKRKTIKVAVFKKYKK